MPALSDRNVRIVNITSSLLEALAKLLWPGIVIVALFYLLVPISNFIDSTLNSTSEGGKVTFRVDGKELELESYAKQEVGVTTELVKEMQRLNNKVIEIENIYIANASHVLNFSPITSTENQSSFTLPSQSSDKIKELSNSGPLWSPTSNLPLIKVSKPLVTEGIKTILWVEDTPENSLVIIKTLRETGIKVNIAQTTEDAIDELFDNVYSLVITDGGRNEPLINGQKNRKAGLNLIQEMNDRNIETPIMMFSSLNSLKKDAFNLGAVAVTSSQNDLLIMVLMNECRDACKQE